MEEVNTKERKQEEGEHGVTVDTRSEGRKEGDRHGERGMDVADRKGQRHWTQLYPLHVCLPLGQGAR